MKNFKSLILSATVLASFSSCDFEEDLVFTAQEPTQNVTFLNEVAESYSLSASTANNIAERFVWNTPSFEAPTTVNFIVEGSITDTFDVVDYTSAQLTANNHPIKVDDLLGMAETLDLDSDPSTTGEDGEPNNAGIVYFRVTAYVGDLATSTVKTVSEVIELNIVIIEETGEVEPQLPRLAVPGDHQGWNPSTDVVDYVPFIAASSETSTDYEGFIDLNNEFKFVGPDDSGVFQWGNADWGDASGVNGSYTMALAVDGEGNCGTTDAGGPGYYLVRADTEALTYSITKTSWGVIGNATPTGWDSDTDMTYDAASRTWSITINLVAQQAPDNGLKFRANDAWDLNLGDNGADGSAEFNGTNISIPEDGNYTITLDLSNPRAYSYTLVKN